MRMQVLFANSCKGEKNMSTLMYRPFTTLANNSEKHIRSLDGPVVTAAGFKDELAVVTHASDCLPSNDQVMPKPVLTLLNLSFPLASSDLGAEALENEFILNNMHLLQIQKRMEEMAGAGLDTTSLDDEAFSMEVAQDRCILRLIA
ncbi:hypothetical protein F2P56_034405, partial [Juglans regia]